MFTSSARRSGSSETAAHHVDGPARRRIGISIAALCAMLAACAIGTAGASAATTVTETFSPTGSEQSLLVPAGVTSVRVRAIAAAGQPGLFLGPFVSASPGGNGALVAAQLPVTPGETLYVHVAEGGGFGGPFAGQGGGASDVRTVEAGAPGSIESRLLVAGGGGGGGSVFDEGSSGRGGDAGSPGREGVGRQIGGVVLQTGGGGAGNATGPGAGGALCNNASPFTTGGEGQLGLGGWGGEGWGSPASGGGGGGGYWGGGGGEGLCQFTEPLGGGGGGGGGSSFVEEGASSALVGLVSSSTDPSVTISYATPATVTPDSSAIAFATQPLGTLSGPQSVTLTNGGGNPLVVSAESFLASSPALETDHPEDFLLSASSCLGPIAFEASCHVTVRFDPQQAGPSTATLQVAANTGGGPTVITLSGTGGASAQGPTGPQGLTGGSGPRGVAGTTGQTGPKGAAGKQGAAGAPGATYFCHTRQLHGKFKNACFVRVASASRPAVTATVQRNGVVYAKGGSARLRAPGTLMLKALRPVPSGTYTLVLVSKHGTTRQRITIR
jgi:hypothetical protein